MKILIIGNGFDLAHGLPTKYIDFLNFMQKIKIARTWPSTFEMFRQLHLSSSEKLDQCVKNYIENAFKNKNKPDSVLRELFEYSKDNFWLQHFTTKQTANNKGWIDFESEISQVIKSFDVWYRAVARGEQDKTYNKEIDSIIKRADLKKPANSIDIQDIRDMKDILLDDLNQLIRCLEIYLDDRLGNFKIDWVSPDIKDINFDKILSFNYTDTYSKTYQIKAQNIDYDFIHGRASVLNNVESNNMVLGIDEYLDDTVRNTDTTFIAFKKFYQRIHKRTGCRYKEWIAEINKKPNEEHEVYIFGHSLDVTDKDVLRELLTHENIKTKIFYYNKDTYGSQIANLVKVLGQDDLIAKVYGENRRIVFLEQKSMMKLSETELEIRADIYNLYNLYNISTSEATKLVNKVKERIQTKDCKYFNSQHNVISIYDAFNALEETICESSLLAIAEIIANNNEKLIISEIDKSNWKNFDFRGEHECHPNTSRFIESLNTKNREISILNSHKIINDISSNKDISNIRMFLTEYTIEEKDILSQIMDSILEKFNEVYVNENQIWETIYLVIDRTNKDILEEYISYQLSTATDVIFKSRLRQIKEVMEEEAYNRRFDDIFQILEG